MKISLQKAVQLIEGSTADFSDLADAVLYKHIYAILKAAIVSGDFPDACELPATRKLAEALGYSRSTIIKSYELLRLEGLVKSKKGSGVLVSYKSPPTVVNDYFLREQHYPELSQLGKAFFQNRSRVNPLDDSHISFRPGLPPLDVFPVEQWKKQSNRYWQMIRASELTYHSAVGMDSLRITLANYLNLSRRIKCDYRQIVIVGGSLQSLFLIGSLLLNPGDGVFIEEQTFPNVHSVFSGLRAKLIPVALDNEGVLVDSVKNSRSRNVKLMHVTPSCQYPLGMQMSQSRRLELVAFAQKKNFYLIENDYEHEVNQTIDPANSLFNLDHTDRTFYISTFNRVLHPSIRVGFMVVPRHLIEPMSTLIRHSHLFVSPSIQLVLRSFIEQKVLHQHISKLGKAINERKQIFEDKLSRLRNKRIKAAFFSVPSLHMLIHLPADVNDEKLANKLQEEGIIVHPLSKCAVGDKKQNGLIVGYASTRPQQMEAKLNALISALEKI